MSIMPASNYLLSHMEGLFNDRENSDFTLFCAGVPMKVHSFILATRSPFFKASLSTPMTEMDSRQMEIMNCSPDVLKQVIRFMYGKNIYNGFTDYANLLEIAERFLMEDLKEAVSHLLSSNLNNETYIEMSQLAEKFSAKVLAEMCAQFIIYKALDVNWDLILTMPIVAKSALELSKQKLTSLVGNEETKNDLVYDCIGEFGRLPDWHNNDAGISKDQLFSQMRSKMTRIEMENSVEYLAQEGHIYSTKDEEHFRATDDIEPSSYYLQRMSFARRFNESLPQNKHD